MHCSKHTRQIVGSGDERGAAASMSLGALRYATVVWRFALAAAFLIAVTDRLGIWGPSGTANVAWGDMPHFMAYAPTLNPWFPKTVIPALAWFVTVAETSLGEALILSFRPAELPSSAAGCFSHLELG